MEQGRCPSEDHMVVLVHFWALGLEMEETKPKDTYMHFEMYKKHCMVQMKDWPIAVLFWADLYLWRTSSCARTASRRSSAPRR